VPIRQEVEHQAGHDDVERCVGELELVAIADEEPGAMIGGPCRACWT
jgi:hypothetical protein